MLFGGVEVKMNMVAPHFPYNSSDKQNCLLRFLYKSMGVYKLKMTLGF